VRLEFSVQLLMKLDITGGESVYCINQAQLARAYELVQSSGHSSERVNEELRRLEGDFDRNERAAVAFVLIDRLLNNRE